MKTFLILLLTLPFLSACGIVGTTAKVATKVVTAPVKVLMYDEGSASDVDYLVKDVYL